MPWYCMIVTAMTMRMMLCDRPNQLPSFFYYTPGGIVTLGHLVRMMAYGATPTPPHGVGVPLPHVVLHIESKGHLCHIDTYLVTCHVSPLGIETA